MRHLEATIDLQRGCQPAGVEPFVPFFAVRCAVCGRRAAAFSENRAAGPRWECRPCRRKIALGIHARQGSQEEGDFSEIAQQSGFLAVVYLDGNGFGRLMANQKSPADFAEISQAITTVFAEARTEILQRFELVDHNQTPIQGGDDLVLILPGEPAIPFARDLLRAVLDHADRHAILQGHHLGASAGIAVGREGFPIRYLLQEAQGLLRSAKRRVYRDQKDGQPRAALDFKILLDGQPTIEEGERPRFHPEATEPLATGRPYTLDEFEVFSKRLDVWRSQREIGRSQLYELSRQAEKGRAQLRNHLLYQIGRRADFREMAHALGQATGQPLPAMPSATEYEELFLPRYGDPWVFDLGDMIELIRFWKEAPCVTA